jgi:hypothetical protein
VTRERGYESDPGYVPAPREPGDGDPGDPRRGDPGFADAGYDGSDERYLDERDVRARYLGEADADDVSAERAWDGREGRGGRRGSGRRRQEVEAEPARSGPLRIVLAIAAAGAIAFLAFAVLARDIPLLASAALVFGVVFVVVAVTAGRATWRAASNGRNPAAFGLAVGGGVAAMLGLGALALAIVLVLIWSRG